MTSELIDDEGDSHYGLPDIWEDKQVVCFHFPDGHAPDGYGGARYHIDSDGTQFMTDSDWNQTGACIGGFSDFENGLALMDEAVATSGGDFAYNSTQYTFGIFFNSIAEVNPCDVSACSDTSGAYWVLFHNGQRAMVGIGDLELDGRPMQMMKDGDSLIVISAINAWNIPQDDPLRELLEVEDGGWRSGSLVKFTVIDISNRSDPQIGRELFIEGSYETARLVNGTVRSVSHMWT